MSTSARLLLIKYLRLSQEDEGEGESDSIAGQRAVIDCFLAQNQRLGDKFQVLEVKDDGYSGTNFDRPGIRRVLELVRRRRVGCIIVKDLSRFGRSYTEVGSYLEVVFPFLGVQFISVNDGYDSAAFYGATGGVGIACRALIHDLYSRDISRKIKSSRRARLRRGDYFCSCAPYGYVKSGEDRHKLAPDPPAAEVVRRIFQMTLAGVGTTEIARALNAEGTPAPLVYLRQKYGRKLNAAPDNFWNNRVVLAILGEERYTGTALSGIRPTLRPGGKKRRKTTREEWLRLPNSFEAIVSQADFQEAQRRVAHPAKKGGGTGSAHPFPRLVRCAGCGRVMSRSNTRARYFSCGTNRFKACPSCVSGHLMERDLTEAVLFGIRQQVRAAADGEQIVQEARQNHRVRLAALERQLRAWKSRRNEYSLSRLELFEKLEDGRLDAEQYRAARDGAERKIRETEAVIERLTAQARALGEKGPEDLLSALFQTPTQPETLPRELAEGLLDSVRVYAPDRIEIRWKYRDEYKEYAARRIDPEAVDSGGGGGE